MCPGGIRKSRESSTVPVCVSLSLGHMWNDHSNSSVVYKTCVNSSRKISTLSGCEPVSPSRIRLPVSACPARYCQKSHHGRRNTLVNIRLVANVPLTLHIDAPLPWYGNSLQTSVPWCHCRLAFRRSCHGAHELVSKEAHELFNSCLRNRLRHQVCQVHTRVNLLRGEPLRLGSLLYPEVLHVHMLPLAQSLAIDQAHRCRGIQVQIQSVRYS